jgi:hypothetical protein
MDASGRIFVSCRRMEVPVMKWRSTMDAMCEIDAIGGILVKGLERYVPPCNKAKHKPVCCHFHVELANTISLPSCFSIYPGSLRP